MTGTEPVPTMMFLVLGFSVCVSWVASYFLVFNFSSLPFRLWFDVFSF